MPSLPASAGMCGAGDNFTGATRLSAMPPRATRATLPNASCAPLSRDPASAGADPDAAAVARMTVERQRLLATVPTWTAEEVACYLGVAEAAVRKARGQGRVLAVDVDGRECYPAFQFSPDGIHPAMREVLTTLGEVPVASDWVRLDILTAPNAAEDDGRSIAELLRDGETAQAFDVIRGYGETGA